MKCIYLNQTLKTCPLLVELFLWLIYSSTVKQPLQGKKMQRSCFTSKWTDKCIFWPLPLWEQGLIWLLYTSATIGQVSWITREIFIRPVTAAKQKHCIYIQSMHNCHSCHRECVHKDKNKEKGIFFFSLAIISLR